MPKKMDAALVVLIVLVSVSILFVLCYWYLRRSQMRVVPLHDLRHMLICFGALIAGAGLAWWRYESNLAIDEQNIYLQIILGSCSLSALFCSISMLLGRFYYLKESHASV